MGLRESDRNYGVVSFAHSYGFSNLITPLLCRGISLVVASDIIPRAIADGLKASSATVFPGVPAIFRSLAEFAVSAGGTAALHFRRCAAGRRSSAAVLRTMESQDPLLLWRFGVWWYLLRSSESPDPPSGYVGPPLEGCDLALEGRRAVDKSWYGAAPLGRAIGRWPKTAISRMEHSVPAICW